MRAKPERTSPKKAQATTYIAARCNKALNADPTQSRCDREMLEKRIPEQPPEMQPLDLMFRDISIIEKALQTPPQFVVVVEQQ